jgi:hypothetical protein
MRAISTFVGALLLSVVRAVPSHAVVPGETEAARIERTYYEQGSQQALEVLAQDYRNALGGADPQAGRQPLDAEISRLEAHTARYAKYSPLVAIATQWCLARHPPKDFPLRYGELLPASDASPEAAAPEVELDREMVKVLQINWINYANLTRSQAHGYVVDEQQITIELQDLLKDQSDQEDVRAAVKGLSDYPPQAK